MFTVLILGLVFGLAFLMFVLTVIEYTQPSVDPFHPPIPLPFLSFHLVHSGLILVFLFLLFSADCLGYKKPPHPLPFPHHRHQRLHPHLVHFDLLFFLFFLLLLFFLLFFSLVLIVLSTISPLIPLPLTHHRQPQRPHRHLHRHLLLRRRRSLSFSLCW